MNRRDRETVKIYLVIIICTYVAYIMIKSYRADNENQFYKSPSIRKKGIVGKIKQKIEHESATPSFYLEMSKIKNDFLTSLKKDKPKWNLLLVLGEIYGRGVFPYVQADDSISIAVYTVASKSPDPDVSTVAISKIMDLRLNPLDRSDRMGEIIDSSYGYEVITASNEWLNSAPESIFVQNRRTLRPVGVPPPNINPFRAFGNSVNIETNPPPIVEIPDVVEEQVDERLYNQSSHDSGVTPVTKNNIRKLAIDFPNDDSDEKIIENSVSMCNEVLTRSKNDKNIGFNEAQLSDAHEVIVSLVPIEYSNLGVTQTKILGKVLQKIETLDDEIKQNVQETLAKRLASGVEKSISVCATGKISRIVSVFEGVDDNVQKGVSIDLVKKEIAQLASKIRDDYLNKLPSHCKKAYCSELSVPQYSEEMATLLEKEATEQYVNKLNIPISVVLPIIKTYAEAY